jgi:hypothetical protein
MYYISRQDIPIQIIFNDHDCYKFLKIWPLGSAPPIRTFILGPSFFLQSHTIFFVTSNSGAAPQLLHYYFYVGYDVLTSVVMKSSIFWDITLYSLLKVNWRHGVISQKMKFFITTKYDVHGVTYQKIELCITTNVRTSNHVLCSLTQAIHRYVQWFEKLQLCLPPVSCWFLAWLILWPGRWRWHVPPKRRLTFNRLYGVMPITMATRSKAWNVFVRSNAGIMGSNPIRSMDVCVRLFCVFVVLCVGRVLVTGWSPV